jgi:alpha-beta hydrolase superfamily lysophospholipase
VTRAPWVGEVLDGRPPAPVVLVLGGFLTSPPLYRPFVRDLLAAGAADLVVAKVWTMDWLLAAGRGLGPILTRSGRALLEASARSEAVAGGSPVLVIGHSAGGISARLLTSPEPFAGRHLNAASRIGAIVTLGTPHVVTLDAETETRAGALAAAFANRVVPGAAFAPRTGYLAIGSRKVVGRRHGSAAERRTFAIYGA